MVFYKGIDGDGNCNYNDGNHDDYNINGNSLLAMMVIIKIIIRMIL